MILTIIIFILNKKICQKEVDKNWYLLIFSLSPHDMTELCMLYENAGRINETEKDNIVHNPRGRCFLISSPNKRTNIDIIATNFTEDMFT